MPSLITPLLLLLSTVSTLSSPLPSKQPTLTESHPYALHNISIFSALNPVHNASTISFTFTDPNAHLKLTTLCERTIPKSKSSSSSSTTPSSNSTTYPDPLADPGNWYACANDSVSFIYAGRGQVMKVQRSYVDESVGEAPWDVVTAFAVTEGAIANVTSKGEKTAGKGKVSRTQWGVSVTIKELKATVTGEIA